MPSSLAPNRWRTRAQLWLGTLVEVALPAAEASDERFGAAFAAIAHVHRKMSPHDPASDLARIARSAHRRAVRVDPATYAVLELAQALAREACAAFDVTVAPALVRSGVLPRRAAGRGARGGRMQALRLKPCLQVASDAPVALDLGGIAKGYAVDRAVAALRALGAHRGLVNAGGDLRAFGSEHWMPIQVRHPQHPGLALRLFDVQDAAVATSADYFRQPRRVLIPRRGRARPFPGSITVIAPTCMLADALTKIVGLQPVRATAVLARYGAHAFRLDAGDEGLDARTTCTVSTAHLRLPAA
jgi:thiamine biosynthesis lipoprotein